MNASRVGMAIEDRATQGMNLQKSRADEAGLRSYSSTDLRYSHQW